MKTIFLSCLIVLTAASVATFRSLPDVKSDKPVIRWITDTNPARQEQVRLFHEWMAKHHPEKAVELVLDAANEDQAKKIIQAVSGVGSDIMDMRSGGAMRYFNAMALLTDVTEPAKRLGFDPSQTYDAIKTEIALEDEDGQLRQYQFPCNVSTHLYFINREAFRKYNVPLPPKRWTVEEFERLGRQFVQAANPPHTRVGRVFFADSVEPTILARSFGASVFNETGTRCTLDDPANIHAMEKIYQWTYVDRLLPSSTDRSGFATESSFGGQDPHLFMTGRYGMLFYGRFLVIETRTFDAERERAGQPVLDLGVCEPPHGGFPNTSIVTRAAAVYIGSKHKDLAMYFLSFLASEAYNLQIVRDGDSLPPNPKYTQIEEFRRPSQHRNEWEIHEPFAEAAQSLGVGASYSPFVLHAKVYEIESAMRDAYMSHSKSAQQAARDATDQINAEIARSLEEDRSLRPRYVELLARQKQIDQYKAEGKKIPLNWIENPFHVAYYRSKGLIDEAGGANGQ